MSTLPDRTGCWGLINSNDGRRDRHTPDVRKDFKLPELEPRAHTADAIGPAFYCKVRKLKSGTFTPFPEYKEDPLDVKIAAARQRAAEIRALKTTVGARPFKPTSGDHAFRLTKDAKCAFSIIPSRTIIFHNPRAPRC